MAEETIFIYEALIEAAKAGDVGRISELAETVHPADLARAYQDLDTEEEQSTFIEALGPERLAPVMRDIPAELVEETLEHLNEEDLSTVLDEVSDDVRVDLLQELPRETQTRYLDLLEDDDQQLTSDLMKFAGETAGGRMTTAIARIRGHVTVKEAIDELRPQEEETEFLSRIYVVDDRDRLVGRVRLRDLTFATWDTPIESIMQAELTTILADADQEEAANLLKRYDLMTLPVVDEFNHLLGVITHDDAMEILEEEASEDIEKIAGIAGDSGEETYLNTPVWTHFKRRFPWLLVLAYAAIASGWVMIHFDEVLSKAYILALFLPMVVAAGGNTGGQASTMVIRGIALGEVDNSKALRVFNKEARLGLMLGSLLGISVFALCLVVMPAFNVQLPDGMALTRFAFAVSLSLGVQVATSTIIGGLLPIGARAAKQDPAVIASPVITTMVDVSGMVIYFGAAKLILGI